MISLCMIVKNEEEYIYQCLRSVNDCVSEIIIVDTGSIDNTVEICKSFGAKIYSFKFNDDFSEARNYCLSLATQPWILVLDADEFLDSSDSKKLSTVINEIEKSGCLGMNLVRYDYFKNGGWSEANITRLFKNNQLIKYKGRVYESVKINKEHLYNNTCKIKIHHYGYLRKDNFIKSKRDKYLKITNDLRNINENDYRLYYWEAQNLLVNNRFSDAINVCNTGIALFPYSKRLYELKGRIYMFMKEYDIAEKMFNEVLKLAREENGDNNTEYSLFFVRALSDLAELFYLRGENKKAIDQYLSLINNGNESALLYANLGYLYEVINDYSTAIYNYNNALKINPFLENVGFVKMDGYSYLAHTNQNFKGIQFHKISCLEKLNGKIINS